MSLLKSGHQVQLLQGGAEFFLALLAAIDTSTVEVRLETYIFHFDASGEDVAVALERAALRGVAVYLVMDGVGTAQVPELWAQRWDHAGVQWHRFSPLGYLGFLMPVRWRRLHRKLCVVDGHLAFCGGINVLNDFVDPYRGPLSSARFDFAVQVTGPLVADAQAAMGQFWGRLPTKRLLTRLQWTDAHELQNTGAMAALVLRDNVRNRTRIERTYRKAIAGARHEVLIANAYFLPGRKLRRALIHAAHRGVRVRLLLQGRYEYFMQYHGARPVYGALLAAGVEIHEYAVGFLHAKVAVVDGHWATVGSSNLEPLSLLLAREANVEVEDVRFAHILHERLTQAIDTHGVRLDPAWYAQRPWRQRALDQLAYGLMRLGLFLTARRY